MLEAALEQMDGIIQGAKYELPQYFDSFSIQDSTTPPSNTVNEALKNLKQAILSSPESDDAGPATLDLDTQEFLMNWLQNNKTQAPSWYKVGGGAVHDLSSVEERMLQLEADKDSLQLQVTVLEDQLDNQTSRTEELEKTVRDKQMEIRKVEEAVTRERNARTNLEIKQGELKHEAANLKLKVARLERDIAEYRNTTPKLQRPSTLEEGLLRSPTPVSSPEDVSPTMPVKKVGPTVLFSEDENDCSNEMDTSMISLSGRSTRGLRKILGKIKRSNSGGFETDRLGSEANLQRGGLRATASGRLGWSAVLNKNKRFSEWSVDTLCSWLETIGLGQYCGEVQRHIGTGADLVRLAGQDLETKLGIRHPLHRKKLVLAMQAKVDTNRPDPAGDLDCAWVMRWLDDVGLPQYKDSFIEARVDGRLLNLLTVDDLSYLKVSSLLHHYSIRRGIQVLRQFGFNSDCLKRRGVPEDEDTEGVILWTNHRVMEWLRQVDLAEYAPNLRGAGVHGGLLVLEPRFNVELLASLLSISSSKTLLRRHLSIHFADLVGRDCISDKRKLESEVNYLPLTPSAKHKSKHGQFTLKRKKSKSEFDSEDCLVCPLSPAPPGQK